MCLLSTQVPNSCRKLHNIHILVLNILKLSTYGYENRRAVSNLKLVLLTIIIQHSTTEVPFKMLALFSLRSCNLKLVNSDAIAEKMCNT